MVAFKSLTLLGLSSLVVSLGCVAAPPPERSVEQARESIINGTKDTTHSAVVALLGQFSECTGTVFSVDGNAKLAYVLSAGHCVNEPGSPADPPQVALVGNDYNAPTTTYPVVNYVAHPLWPQNQDYDYSIVTINWANKPQPAVIPLITKVQDNLAPGSQVDFVGYGVTSVNGPGQNNSLRYHVLGLLDQVSTVNVHYNQSNQGQYANNAGPCSGDSGGPALYTVAGVGEVVAAVTSRGDGQCNVEGFSSRVSNVLDWVSTCINGGDCSMIGAQTCDQCAQSSTSQGGACENAWNACTNDADCVALVQCLNNCGPQSCVDACVQNNPNGVDLYSATLQCICDSGCPSECANAAFCQSQPMGCGFTADAACQTCFEGSCCDEATSCSNDAACVDCLTNANADPSCFDTNANAGAFLGCLQQNCSSECGVGGGGVGGGGIGGGSAGGTGGTGGALLAGGTGGGGTGGAGGSPAGGGPSANGGNGGSGTSTTTITCGACRTGTGSTDSDGAAAVLGAALLGLFAARRRRDPR